LRNGFGDFGFWDFGFGNGAFWGVLEAVWPVFGGVWPAWKVRFLSLEGALRVAM
jgi:hypothetical protein